MALNGIWRKLFVTALRIRWYCPRPTTRKHSSCCCLWANHSQQQHHPIWILKSHDGGGGQNQLLFYGFLNNPRWHFMSTHLLRIMPRAKTSKVYVDFFFNKMVSCRVFHYERHFGYNHLVCTYVSWSSSGKLLWWTWNGMYLQLPIFHKNMCTVIVMTNQTLLINHYKDLELRNENWENIKKSNLKLQM